MKYCHTCGFKLSSSIEKLCPECGQDLTQEKEVANGISITDTEGDVIGAGIKGTGHIIGKNIDYIVKGNVINLNISGGNISNEIIDSLKKIINTPTQIDQKSLTTAYDRKDIQNKLEDINNTQKQITSILQEVDNIEKKEGTQPIEEIRSENIQISTKELLLKEHILKGNEYYYKKEYDNAIQYFDKALEIDANNAAVWNNKGVALKKLGKHEEAIQCYDKALEIDVNDTDTWYNQGNALNNLGKRNEAIQCYDRVLEIDANHSKAWYSKGLSLFHLGKPSEAIQCFDKALEIDANHSNAWYSKGLSLHHLGKPSEAIQCYDKALDIDSNNELFNKNRNIVLEKLGKTEKKSGWKGFFER